MTVFPNETPFMNQNPFRVDTEPRPFYRARAPRTTMARVPMEPTMAAPAVGTGVGSEPVSSAGGATTLVSVSAGLEVPGATVDSGEGSGTGVGSGAAELSGAAEVSGAAELSAAAEEEEPEEPPEGGFSQSLEAAGRTSSMDDVSGCFFAL